MEKLSSWWLSSLCNRGRRVGVLNLAPADLSIWQPEELIHQGSWTQDQQLSYLSHLLGLYHTWEQPTKSPQLPEQSWVFPHTSRTQQNSLGGFKCHYTFSLTLGRVHVLEKPPAFSSCISSIKELIPCNTPCFTASPHPSCQGCFFFLVFQGEHFPPSAILIWTPGLEIMAHNCKNGLTFNVLTLPAQDYWSFKKRL